MGVITKKIKGTEDVLPKDSYRWQFVEDVMQQSLKHIEHWYKRYMTDICTDAL